MADEAIKKTVLDILA
nr:D-alanyl carrier protein, Dcp {N-terminal} [Lactobacillus casei, ATCC 7469, Peptide Partial, 15 aa] [Lacticaseibacillus casei]